MCPDQLAQPIDKVTVVSTTQRQDVLLIRQIRSLLYDQGFTIGGARQQLDSDNNNGSDHQPAEDKAAYKAVLRQMISELEEVLAILKAG